MYSINYRVKLICYYLQKLALVYEAMSGLLGSHLDLPEYIKMIVPCRLIQSLEVAFATRKCSYAKIFTKYMWQRTHFQVKLRTEAYYQNF